MSAGWEMLGAGVASRRMHVLVSSMSARGRAIRVGPEVVRRLRGGGWDVTVSVTTPDDDPRVMAEQSDAPFVAGLGGDGYLSAVAQGVSRTGAIFVPLPGGRGNDLCRAVGAGPDPLARASSLARLGLVDPTVDADAPFAAPLDEADGVADRAQAGNSPVVAGPVPSRPSKRWLRRSEEQSGEACSVEERLRPLDGMWVEEEGRPARLVLGVVSLGVEAHANDLANESFFRSGPMAYAYGAFGALATYRQYEFRALVDGVERDLSGWVASVSNSGRIGGGIDIVPDSAIDDGRIELVHVGDAKARQVVTALTKVVATRSLDHPLVEVSDVREVAFTAPHGHVAWADGDPVARVPFTVRVAPAVVTALV